MLCCVVVVAGNSRGTAGCRVGGSNDGCGPGGFDGGCAGSGGCCGGGGNGLDGSLGISEFRLAMRRHETIEHKDLKEPST